MVYEWTLKTLNLSFIINNNTCVCLSMATCLHITHYEIGKENTQKTLCSTLSFVLERRKKNQKKYKILGNGASFIISTIFHNFAVPEYAWMNCRRYSEALNLISSSAIVRCSYHYKNKILLILFFVVWNHNQLLLFFFFSFICHFLHTFVHSFGRSRENSISFSD